MLCLFWGLHRVHLHVTGGLVQRARLLRVRLVLSEEEAPLCVRILNLFEVRSVSGGP